MKKYYIIILIVFFCFCCNVTAKTYTCEYVFGKNNQNNIWQIEYNTDEGTFKNNSEKESGGGTEYQYDYNFYEDEIKGYDKLVDKDKNYCPILFVVEDTLTTIGDPETSASGTRYQDYYIFTSSFLRESEYADECISNRDMDICWKHFVSNYTNYYETTLTDSETNKTNTQGTNCPFYTTLKNKVEENYKSYKDSDFNCLECKNNANRGIENLKEMCHQILARGDVYIQGQDGKLIKEECVQSCLGLKTDIDELNKKYDISASKGSGECGFSEKLILWIANIIRWVKYIVPVAVIVLGILDFIKAMSADKEDEMKKAQQRFIRRLIAAALIFIVPFIIEFVLNKMGFDSNGCGIINL